MRCPGLPLCGLLWLGLPLLYGRPVKIDKVKADAKNLTRTLIARIQELQVRGYASCCPFPCPPLLMSLAAGAAGRGARFGLP